MPRALSLLALLLAVSVAVASASTFSVEYVPSHPQRNHVALCTSVSDECRALPPVTPSGAWGAPNVLDNSWIPARWCRGAKCTQGAPTPSFVTVLKNVAVGAAGLVYDRQNWYADPLVVNAESWEFPATAQDPEITGSVPKAVHVATRFSHNYYHFLTEALPRLMTVRDLLQADPELKVLMNDVPFVRETLALMGLEERLVPVALPGYSDFSFTDAVAVEELIYPSGVSMYSPSLLVIDEIRQALGVRTLPAAQRTKIIYISRANAAERSVENERELISTLRAQFPGEEIVVFTPENMESTIRLFEQAKMIIGAHGAGLTNAIFSAPGTKVVEFLFTSEPITLFWRLSSELEQEYWAVPVPASSWKSSLKVPVVEVIEVMSRALGRTVESSQTCNPGEFLSKATGRCTKCSSGFVAQQDHCSICPAATFANVRGTACVPCPASTNTYLYGSTYEPSYIEGIMASLGASSPSACYSKRTARAMVMATAACPGGYGSYSVNNNNALLTGDNRYIASSVSNPSVSAVSVENLTWFKDVPGNETHTFTITNTSPKYTLFLTSVTLNAVGGHRSASLWNVVSQPATVVPPSTSTTFAIQYAPGSPNPVGTPDQVKVLVTVCNGPSLSFIAQGTTVTIPLIINPDFYTTTWVQGLLVPVTQGVLANDVSLQGQLQVTSTSAVTTTALPTPGASSLGNTGTSQATLVIAPTGNFSLVFAPNFVGYATFTYTAANAYTSGTGVVNVTVNAVSSNIVCPANITINAPLGFNSTPIAWESANASYSAPVTQTAGPQAGSIFSALGGPIQISYSAGALPGVLASNCSFFVTVAIAPPVIVCPSPITVTSPTCTLPVTLPSATASGYYTQVTTSVASPATLPIGQNSITYTVTDAVGQTASCSLVVNVALQQARYQFDQLSGYPDQDHDGYGAVGSSCIDGARTPTPGKVLLGPNDLLSVNNLDCDDTNPQTNPGSNEICDGLDNNCNGLIDEGRVCQLFDADLPVEAAPVMLRPAVVDQRSLPSLPPTIVTVVRPFTIPVYTNVASWVQLSAPLLCVMLLVSFLLL